MTATIDRQMDALLCHYYLAFNADTPWTVTAEELERTYPRIDQKTLAAVGARLESAGLIRPVRGGGHFITLAGVEAYLAD